MTFVYGDRDWMDPRGGQRALAGARQHRQPTTPGDLRLFTVKKSGHYTFIDQVQCYDQRVTRWDRRRPMPGTVNVIALCQHKCKDQIATVVGSIVSVSQVYGCSAAKMGHGHYS